MVNLQAALDTAVQHRQEPPGLKKLLTELAQPADRPSRPPFSPMQDDEAKFAEAPTLDPAALDVLREIAGGSGDSFLREMIGSYLQEAPCLVAAIGEAIAQADFSTVVNHTHSFKSMSAALGASQLAEQCQQMEILAQQPQAQVQTLQILQTLQRSLCAELEEVHLALEALLPHPEST